MINHAWHRCRASRPESRTSDANLVTEVKRCERTKNLDVGRMLHMKAETGGRLKSRCVSTALISMYSKCGSMEEAHKVFERMIRHDVVSWTVLMLGYVENGLCLEALNLFDRMDCAPDSVVLVAAIKACARLASESPSKKTLYLKKGIFIHKTVQAYGLEAEVSVSNTFVDMYSKCGDMKRAQSVFDKMNPPGVVALSALVLGYVENGESITALHIYKSMHFAPDRVLVVAGLKACAALAREQEVDKKSCLLYGRFVHQQAKDNGFHKEISVANSLIDMYSKCGSIKEALHVFNDMCNRDVVSWNTLILGYALNGHSSAALDAFDRMDCSPNAISFVAALKACGELARTDKSASLVCLQRGLRLHRKVNEQGLGNDTFVLSTVVDMYSKCGSMSLAKKTFDSIRERDAVAWNALMLGCVNNGESRKALEIFDIMNCVPDRVSFIAALKACASLGALERGQNIHAQACELKLEHDEAVASCLIDFYGKCGHMFAAEDVFSRLRSKSLVSWNALIGGYSLVGNASRVFSLLKSMEECGQRADGVTMLLVLSACSHAGMVVEGQRYFESMSKLGVSPTVEHYTCMVDMLGRANRLSEALLLVKEMPLKADSQLWLTLLGACRNWNNLVIGQVAFDELLARNDKDHIAAAYVLIQNIYESLKI